jgi:uncharacterized protein YydD (DUF2326 family)
MQKQVIPPPVPSSADLQYQKQFIAAPRYDTVVDEETNKHLQRQLIKLQNDIYDKEEKIRQLNEQVKNLTQVLGINSWLQPRQMVKNSHFRMF